MVNGNQTGKTDRRTNRQDKKLSLLADTVRYWYIAHCGRQIYYQLLNPNIPNALRGKYVLVTLFIMLNN